GQRPSLIQAKQTASKRTAQPAKLALRGFTFDNHREVNHPCAKAPRDFGQSLFNHLIEFARIHLFPWYHISPLGEWALVLQSSPRRQVRSFLRLSRVYSNGRIRSLMTSRRLCYPLLFLSIGLLLVSVAGSADGPRVSLEPRAKPVTDLQGPRTDIRVDATVVLINVTVTGPRSRVVDGLEKENFRLFEDRAEQKVVHFANEDSPVSVGLVFDSSGSMGSRLAKSRQAVSEFFKTANPADEFF